MKRSSTILWSAIWFAPVFVAAISPGHANPAVAPAMTPPPSIRGRGDWKRQQAADTLTAATPKLPQSLSPVAQVRAIQ
ncbi:hypothetical protein QBC35DRAFT_497155 [Podospora australis]|uniref:Uncharacterized protein n=1 Tax=Podospora australis TaxID=1536484 RepID=A0AAN6WXW6_9PEZI|nr:hypothetical protein QBC35DRAFT_497155 [Podospora australis]